MSSAEPNVISPGDPGKGPMDSTMGKSHLGNVRLRHHETNEIILVPTPSKDPNDPLNWSTAYRRYVATLVSIAIFMSNFLAAGVSVAIVEIAADLLGAVGPGLSSGIAKASYLLTVSALLQGLGNLFWMPLIVKFGRRPVYIASFLMYTVTAAWAGAAKSFASSLAARALMGFASGSAETLAPLTISDIFFLHERGRIMAIYTAALGAGSSGGIILSGLITINLSWRYIYWVAVPIIGACTVLMFFTFPETEYKRAKTTDAFLPASGSDSGRSPTGDMKDVTEASYLEDQTQPPNGQLIPPKKTYRQTLSLYSGVYTKESFFKLVMRPIFLLALPPVLWATLVMSVSIGFLVAVSSNFASAFATHYGFLAYQSGLCYGAALVGALLGVFFGGTFSDKIADFFTRQNGGIREAEMRLPALVLGNITMPLALLLYGFGISKGMHWIVPTLGLGIYNFALVQATNITLVYTIDSFRPVAGEVVVTQFVFKSAFGFLLSFYLNPWIEKSGYEAAFGTMAAICFFTLAFWIVFFTWGTRIKYWSWHWGFIKRVAHWSEDREVGE